jgi:protein-arginine kinase activator protein McsA
MNELTPYQLFDTPVASALTLCQYCENEATLLCDGKINDETCDRRICDECAKQIGIAFYCGENVFGTEHDLVIDTTDLCPRCAKLGGRFETDSYKSERTLLSLRNKV